MTTSQNGWPALQYGDPLVVPLVVDGLAFPAGVRKGDVETVLTWAIQEAAKRTGEKPIAGQCWCQSVQKIAGSSDTSNHASCTAFD
jgi:hypothetical protein